MTTTLKGRGIKLAIFSGGFISIARRLQADYGFDEVIANTLESRGGKGDWQGGAPDCKSRI